mgnify:FL=1
MPSSSVNMDILQQYAALFVTLENGALFKLTLALFLGLLLGLERTVAGKMAGMRTYGLVSLASCLLTVSYTLLPNLGVGYNQAIIISGVISGIGFLGAGLIIFHDDKLVGLTSAAGLWIAVAVGLTVGYGMYALALFATFLTLFVFTGMWYLERSVRSVADNHSE